jgi:long-chain acyl-CoA synthetase
MNLTELLEKAASFWPQKPALVEGNRILTYAALLEEVNSWASRFPAPAFPPGSRIGLAFPNGIEYVALTYALWRLQAVVVPIPTECTEVEVEEIAHALQLDAIVSEKQRSCSVAIGANCFLTRLQPAPVADNHGLNIAFIRFTSGTTSARKGVVLTHETIRDRIQAANQALNISSQDTVIWCLPMSHHFLVTIVLYLAEGATVVLARHVLAAPFLEAVNRWQGTVLYASPFHFGLLARDASDVQMPSVRLAVSTTCPLTEDVALAFQQRFNHPLAQALGVIELGLVSVNLADPAGRWNSVGRPVKDFAVQILAPDENGCGEVAVRGPGMCDAYAAPWWPRERFAPDGWFRTGDIGRIDADGFLFLLSRKKAVINLAGRKVFPEEIEAVLNRHPAVRESRAYGRAHPHLGEVIEAELVLEHGEADLDGVRAFCREHLASYKIPARLHVVTALPRTAVTGKIRREAVAV